MKVHGVFPCNHIFFASSQRFQFHWVNSGDSKAVVTSFMHVRTYLTRNFATLGPSELRPPFVVDSFWGIIPRQLLWQRWADVELYTSCYHLARSCVFTKQSLLSFFCDHHWLITYTTLRINCNYYLVWRSFSRSYRANLPSSFKIVLSRALVYSTYPPVSVIRYGLI